MVIALRRDGRASLRDWSDLLNLEGKHGVAGVERALEELAAGPTESLVLPTKLQQRRFGGDAAVMQFIATWRRANPDGRVMTYLRPEHGRGPVQEFLTHDHGLAAFVLAGELTYRDGQPIDGVVEMADARLRPMIESRWGELRGIRLSALCIDDDTWRARPSALYAATPPANPPPRSRGGFVTLLQYYLERAYTSTAGARTESSTMNPFAHAVRELFVNTHEWATTDAFNRRIRPSLRGVRAELHSYDHEQRIAFAAELPALTEYVSNPALPRTPTGRAPLVEVSVLDTGPGLTARRVREHRERGTIAPADELSIEREYGAAIDCLRRRISTSTESFRGMGLHGVLTSLTSLTGFVRVRSGRLALYRDLLAHPYRPDEDSDEPYLLDESSGSRAPTERADTAGTVVTFLFPAARSE